MTATMTLEKVKKAAADRAADAEARYATLVRQVADGGKAPDAVKLLDQLAEWGRTFEQFEADVAIREERNRWRVEAAKLPELREQWDKARVSIREADAALEAEVVAARQRHAAAVAPIMAEERRLATAVRVAEQADSNLMDSSDPATAAKLAAVDAERQAAVRELDRLKQLLHETLRHLPATKASHALVQQPPWPRMEDMTARRLQDERWEKNKAEAGKALTAQTELAKQLPAHIAACEERIRKAAADREQILTDAKTL